MVGLDGREILNSSPSIICSSPSISTPLAKSDSVRQKRQVKAIKKNAQLVKMPQAPQIHIHLIRNWIPRRMQLHRKSKNIKSSKAKAAARRKARAEEEEEAAAV